MGITLTFVPPHFVQTKCRCFGTSTKIISFQSFNLLERLHRLMVTADAEAMHGERRLAGGASVGNGLCRLATRHLETISSGLNMKRPFAAP